jgi:hypothetical protein
VHRCWRLVAKRTLGKSLIVVQPPGFGEESLASARPVNKWVLRPSSRKRLLKRSLQAFWNGLPGSMNCNRRCRYCNDPAKYGGGDPFVAREVGVGAGRELELAHGGANELLAGVVPDLTISSHDCLERI